jgi:hypothetical protein
MLNLLKVRSFLAAIAYFICHPFDVVSLTIVRRYVDAQGNYIGELYEGADRTAHMIGATCDNLPLDADTTPLKGTPRLCAMYSFLDPLPVNTLRVGAMEPMDHAGLQAYICLRRFNTLKIIVLNRFVEHIMGMPV